MLRYIRRIYPRYTVFPLLTVLVMNFLVYNGSVLLTRSRVHCDMTTALDRLLPLVPFFVLFYVLAFVQWVVGYTLIARESEQSCYEFLSGELVAKLLCFVILLCIPATMSRPEVPGHDLWSWLLRFIYRIDKPVSLFPSIHCVESWLCFRGALRLQKPPRAYKWGCLALTLLVFAATVLVKQHVVVDVFAGVAVAELGLFLSKRLRADRVLRAVNRRLCRQK